ncbi:hypothetical protein [Marinobacter sp. MBR-105]|jgi:magnesium-transporting ATPase (P-type)
MKEKYVTHNKYRFWLAMLAITVPLMFPVFIGTYLSRSTGDNLYFWAGILTGLFFVLCARIFEQTIRREGAAQGWSEAFEENGKPLNVGDVYPGWNFPKFPD